MVFLALEEDLPGTDAGAFAPHLEAEAARVWTLQQQGVLRQIWFRQDRSAAVLLLECPDRRSAEEALASLPLVQQGLIRFDLIPLSPYPGLARLFRKDLPPDS